MLPARIICVVFKIAPVLSFVHALDAILTFNVGLHLRLPRPMSQLHVAIILMFIEALVTKTTVPMLVVEITQPLLVVLLFLVFH